MVNQKYSKMITGGRASKFNWAKVSLALTLALLLVFSSALAVFAAGGESSAGFGSTVTDKVIDLDFLDYVETTELEGVFGSDYRAEDIHLPYFDFDGSGAFMANSEVEALAKEIAKTFDDEETVEFHKQYFDVQYTVYEDDDILSVMISLDIVDGSPYNKIIAYNFDPDSGDLFSLEEMQELLDLEDAFSTVIEKNIIDLNEKFTLRFFGEGFDKPTNPASVFTAECFNTLWADFEDLDRLSNINLWIDPSGEPYFSYIQFVPAGSGYYTEKQALNRYSGLAEDLLNPLFVKVVKGLDLDLDFDDDDVYGLIADLGSVDFEDSDFTQPLYGLYFALGDYMGPDVMAPTEWSDDETKYLINGTEAVLVIPRLAHATLGISQDWDGYIGSYDLAYGMKSVLAIFPKKNDEKLLLSYRYRDQKVDELLKYKKGNLVIPEGFIDIKEELSDLEVPEEFSLNTRFQVEDYSK